MENNFQHLVTMENLKLVISSWPVYFHDNVHKKTGFKNKNEVKFFEDFS